MSKLSVSKLDWRLCMADDLTTYDPYDIWKTKLGFNVKNFFNKNRRVGKIPAAILTVFDLTINNRFRLFYTRQEYPIVRAQAALVLLSIFKQFENSHALAMAKIHLDWLVANQAKGYSGPCWGINFPWASVNAEFSTECPFITHTVYPLEAMERFNVVTGSSIYADTISSAYGFISNDLIKYVDNEKELCLSYSPVSEIRNVINANAYAMFALSIIRRYRPNDHKRIDQDITRIYNFIVSRQNSDGSWWYFADRKEHNFIDCFHSCFVIKNILKVGMAGLLPNTYMQSVDAGYRFLTSELRDHDTRLFKRFAQGHLDTPTKFDLYDNAEMLNLAGLMGDKALFQTLHSDIEEAFSGKGFCSVIDKLGRRLNKNMLRWAVMPYLHAVYTNSEVMLNK